MDVVSNLLLVSSKFSCKTTFSSYCLKLSLPMFLKCFLIFAKFQYHVSYRHVSYKKKNFSRLIIQEHLLCKRFSLGLFRQYSLGF